MKGFTNVAALVAGILAVTAGETKAQGCFSDGAEVDYANLGTEIEDEGNFRIALIQIEIAATVDTELSVVKQGTTHSVGLSSEFDQNHDLVQVSAEKGGGVLTAKFKDNLNTLSIKTPSGASTVSGKASMYISAGVLAYAAQSQQTTNAMIGTMALSTFLLATGANAQCPNKVTITVTLPETSKWQTSDVVKHQTLSNGAGTITFIRIGPNTDPERPLN